MRLYHEKDLKKEGKVISAEKGVPKEFLFHLSSKGPHFVTLIFTARRGHVRHLYPTHEYRGEKVRAI